MFLVRLICICQWLYPNIEHFQADEKRRQALREKRREKEIERARERKIHCICEVRYMESKNCSIHNSSRINGLRFASSAIQQIFHRWLSYKLKWTQMCSAKLTNIETVIVYHVQTRGKERLREKMREQSETRRERDREKVLNGENVFTKNMIHFAV